MSSAYQRFEFMELPPLSVDSREQGNDSRGIPTESGKFRRGKRNHISYSDHAQNITHYSVRTKLGLTFTVSFNFCINSFFDVEVIYISVAMNVGNAIFSTT